MSRAFAATRDRAHCPEIEQIQGYVLGTAQRSERASIEAHLGTCLHCAAEVAASREFLVEPSARPVVAPAAAMRGMLGTLRRVVATLLPAEPVAHAALAVRDVEGEGLARPQIFAAEGVEVSLRSERQGASFTLYGTLSTDGSDELSAPIAALLRALTDDGAAAELVAEVPVEFDAFEFAGIDAGAYAAQNLFPDRLIELAPIHVVPS
jgi:hypothetical protein